MLLIGCCALAACSSPSRLRLQIGLAADAAAAAAGPTVLTIYTVRGVVLDGATVPGTLPGDVVVLLDDDSAEARAYAHVDIGGGIMVRGVVRGPIEAGKETTLPLTLSAQALADTDGDGVPDAIDDCVGTPDPAQESGCQDAGVVDLSTGLCGNGTLDPGEACDDGPGNSDEPTKQGTCTTGCVKRSPCGKLFGAFDAIIDPATGHCYVSWSGPSNFTAAERSCLQHGGHLAAVTSDAENAIIEKLSNNQPSWIGLVVPPVGQDQVWTTTEKSAYAAFRIGEPTRGAESCVVSLGGSGGWEDRACGWPTTGNLPVSAPSTAAYICENSCGNGVVDPGEDCDPPGPGCTDLCRTVRPCTESGGVTSEATGACYFQFGASVSYATALATGCPSGTHLATPTGPLETDAVLKAINTDAWIAVHAPTQPGVFSFDVAGFSLDTTRYHGFLAPDPDQTPAPACVIVTHSDVRGDAWRDRACGGFGSTNPSVCERD